MIHSVQLKIAAEDGWLADEFSFLGPSLFSGSMFKLQGGCVICFRDFHGVSVNSLLGLEALLLGRGDRRMI